MKKISIPLSLDTRHIEQLERLSKAQDRNRSAVVQGLIESAAAELEGVRATAQRAPAATEDR
jgi:predicted DNA-binding protein